MRLYHFVRNVGQGEEPRGYAVEDREAGYVLRPGFQAGGVRINSLGFRGREIAATKPTGTYRVVALGDSASFGPTEEECAYPFLLDTALRDRGVEVVNGAVEGYRTDRALVRLRTHVLPLKPDLVTVFIGWNDLYQTDPHAEAEQLSIRGNPLAQALAASDAAQTFRRMFFLRVNPRRGQDAAPTADPALATYRPEGYAERLRQIFRAIRAGGAETLTLTWPTLLADNLSPEGLARVHYPWHTTRLPDLKLLYQRYQETLRTVAVEERVPVVDAAALFDGVDRAAAFKDTAHFTCDGQRMIADLLTRQLDAGVVPGYPRR